MLHQLGKVSILVWQCEFEHHVLIGTQLVQFRQDCSLQPHLGLGLLWAIDIHFGFDDWN